MTETPPGRSGPAQIIAGLQSWGRSIKPDRRHFGRDVVAGLPGAISSVPDGMASAVLVGVNPVHGLYASFAGPLAGGLTSSTQLMVITTTTAAALAAGSAVSGVAVEQRSEVLILLTVLAGLVMIAAGLLRLGRYTRFVSHSVMTGFLTGVAVNIICGQLGDLSGVAAQGSNALAKALDVITHPGSVNVASLLSGLAALVILFGLAKTRWNMVSALVALIIPTLAVVVAGADSVARVEDAGAIPKLIPAPSLPDLSLISFDLIVNAFAIAVIVLVQGAGVSEAAPNADGRPSNMNRDFLAQGAGNIASGLFRGQPVGGSVGQTAVNAAAGARTRWAAIWSGIWMVVILVAFGGLVGKVVMPTLAAVLIFAAISSLRPHELTTILRTGRISQVAMAATFAATLFLPVAAAVGLGVVLSLLLQLNQEAMDLKVVELVPPTTTVPRAAGAAHARQQQVTVLDVYGSLFYAGARTLQARLPESPQPRRQSSSSACGVARPWARRSSGSSGLRRAARCRWRPPLPVGARPGHGPAVGQDRTRNGDVPGPCFGATPVLASRLGRRSTTPRPGSSDTIPNSTQTESR